MRQPRLVCTPRLTLSRLVMAACLIFGFMAGDAARAAPPENADSSLAPWFQSLRQPGTGISFCSMADCRPIDYRMNEAGYEALIDNKWLPVPPDRVLQHTENPTGRAIACYMPGRGILCFVRPAET